MTSLIINLHFASAPPPQLAHVTIFFFGCLEPWEIHCQEPFLPPRVNTEQRTSCNGVDWQVFITCPFHLGDTYILTPYWFGGMLFHLLVSFPWLRRNLSIYVIWISFLLGVIESWCKFYEMEHHSVFSTPTQLHLSISTIFNFHIRPVHSLKLVVSANPCSSTAELLKMCMWWTGTRTTSKYCFSIAAWISST